MLNKAIDDQVSQTTDLAQAIYATIEVEGLPWGPQGRRIER